MLALGIFDFFPGILDKLNEYGNELFEFVLGKFYNVPGALQGLITIVICFLSLIGLFHFFKKSIKFALTIVGIAVALYLASMILAS